MCFFTNTHSKFADFLSPPHLARHDRQCALQKGLSKGAVPAYKALHGSESKTRELQRGTKGNIILHDEGSVIGP